MKVISLLQPWATLVVMGHKKIETRSWNTKYRGEILIHASVGKNKDGLKLWHNKIWDKFPDFANMHFVELPFGEIIGKVNLVDTFPTEMCKMPAHLELRQWYYNGKLVDWSKQEEAFGDYSPNRYGYLLSDPVKFSHQYPIKGSLSLWNFPEQICLKCGCTENDACISKDFGPCWWADENLCSHCAEGVNDLIIPT